MYSSAQLAFKYLRYWLSASNGKGHGMHSPFVFDLITKVLRDRTSYPEYKMIEEMRNQLEKDETKIEVEDFGAGSNFTNRMVSSIARHAAKPKKYGQLLFRLVKYYQPAQILEMGTSLGISTSYLASARADAVVTTMEGATNVAALARGNFASLGLKNISLVLGNFDHTLSSVLRRLPALDFVFIDGNHRREPTTRYFEMLLPHVTNDTILVFDDIHWSREMEQAWSTVRSHSSVRCTIDLFFVGLVFFRQEFREKRNFSIRF